MADRPQTLHDHAAIAQRQGRIDEPHVKPLNDLVRQMVARAHPAPWVDPDGGGTGARILFLAESPGPRASAGHGSGLVSIDNNDQTAKRCWTLMRQAQLAPDECINWNAVPCYVGSHDGRNKNATLADWRAAADWFEAFLQQLPRLRVVVPMGRFAEDCWTRYRTRPDSRRLPALLCPHPSVQARRGRPNFEAEILDAMIAARHIVRESA